MDTVVAIAAAIAGTAALGAIVVRVWSKRRSQPVDVDEAELQRLAGQTFDPDELVQLPSGRCISGDEAQVLAAFYAPAAGRRVRR